MSVAWAGDSRAVLGVCDTSLGLAASACGSLSSADSGSASASASLSSVGSSAEGSLTGASDSYDGFLQPLCAAVPLTEDHKPDK